MWEGVAVSKFQVGDRVRCVSATGSMSVGETDTVFNADPHDGTMLLSKSGGWWFRQSAFELVSPPQPAGSPDDWVTQDVVPARPGIDQRAYQYDTDPKATLQWDDAGAIHWDYMPMNGEKGNCFIVHLRCRRRDYPQRPVEVHAGGPYVARSKYERVCLERDNAVAAHKQIQDNEVVKPWQEVERLRRELANEKANSGQVIAGLRDSLKQTHLAIKIIATEREQCEREVNRTVYDLNAVRATLEKRDAEVANLRHEQSVLLADLKNFEDTTAALNKRVLGGNPNGWPLVPVDPSCIPDGHRAIEVTTRVKGKFVAGPQRTIFMHNREHTFPRLVVEPIPTPQAQDTLQRPEFPVWIRAGWWVAMDPDSVFWVFEYEPKVDEQCGEYTSRGKCVLLSDDQLTPSMRAVPVDRWRKAKWQIE